MSDTYIPGTFRRDGGNTFVIGESGRLLRHQGDPATVTDAATLTFAQLTAGIITGTQSSGSTNALTLPTGAVMAAALDFVMEVNESFDVSIINTSAAAADTYTLTAASGFTIVGDPIIEAAHASSDAPNAAMFRIRRTAAATFVAYRIA